MADSAISKKTILVVDDSQENLIIMKDILYPEFVVKATTDGKSALQIAALHPPDMFLLDVVMPSMSGYDLCQRIKNDMKTSHIPVLFITTLSDRDNVEFGLAVGAVDYIIKPFDPGHVRELVRKYLTVSAALDPVV